MGASLPAEPALYTSPGHISFPGRRQHAAAPISYRIEVVDKQYGLEQSCARNSRERHPRQRMKTSFLEEAQEDLYMDWNQRFCPNQSCNIDFWMVQQAADDH